uniref:uncharacterized protein LOC101612529 n=1 Tax=Jaculus jaculus TaxID=51337 RepID=UPI001E1B48E6|nr:uncharacterized protein LOC101612529 [Jaculus jaculus]
MQGSRVALTLSSLGVSATAVAALDGLFEALGFETYEKREVSDQGFLQELGWFREQLDALRGPVGCALVALVAPTGQLRQPQPLVLELSRCRALQGCPKIFLLLSSGLEASTEPGAFLTGLREICGQFPHWSLLQLLTEASFCAFAKLCLLHGTASLLSWPASRCPFSVSAVPFPVLLASTLVLPAASFDTGALFRRVAHESSGDIYCPVLQSSLRGALCLGHAESWWPEPNPEPSAQYDLSGARAALLLVVTRDRAGAQCDVAALVDLCQALGFKVTLRTDPTAQEFCEELVHFQKRLDTHRGPVSCVLVALMAHGGPRGQLLGADGGEVQPEMLMQELSCCRALRGRPKIFLLQACRGGNRDPGVGPRALPWYRRWLGAPPAIPTRADVLQVYADAQEVGTPWGRWSPSTVMLQAATLPGAQAKQTSWLSTPLQRAVWPIGTRRAQTSSRL